MEKKIIKYGVVGLKRGADVAVEGRNFENARLCAACDHDPETLAAAKARLEHNFKDCKFYSDLDEMLKSDIDAVIVATEAIYHVPIVKKVMEAGKHVLSEIPSVNTLEEAHELKAIASAHPELIYMAGENCCYWAFIETWKKMREQGDFGEVVYVEGDYLHAGHPDKFDPDQYKLPDGTIHWRAYNPAIKYITHELGPILYILDDRCVSVTCFEPDVVYNPYFPERKSNGVALIKTAKGTVIRVFICFGAYVGAEHKFRLFGTRGNIVTDNTKIGSSNSHSFATLYSVPESNKEKIDIPVTTVYEGEDASTGHGGADRKMLADFISCVAEGRRPTLDVDFAINMSLPGILAHESAVRGGVPIEIPRF